MSDSRPLADSCLCIEAGVRYGPVFEVAGDGAGGERLVLREGVATIRAPVAETALVMIDIWSTRDALPGEPPPPEYACLAALLEQCRAHGMTIIHAPNEPVVQRYAQYHRLVDELDQFTAQQGRPVKRDLSFMRWPPASNEVFARSHALRVQGREVAYAVRGDDKKDISRHIDVAADDYVVATHEQYRYVLWKHGITTLLYAGGSLHECMLHRDTGLNLISGTDTRNAKFTPIVMEDCAFIGPHTSVDSETMRTAMLEYYKQKLAFVGRTPRLAFRRVPADERARDVIAHAPVAEAR